ncbi:hypothetical protein PILCRDRAFT_820676 [Piloderma croceum F 1598]|uniref:Protein kinase domain-containing protein n=1 Tax=Piloderma croceum (strain F 1598) TaxID=765440 RepID=A0A0C3BY49_PILCF|nr:hypothetical protein PILCRDRAFT_820676 [Piloderma croceum F 1598]
MPYFSTEPYPLYSDAQWVATRRRSPNLLGHNISSGIRDPLTSAESSPSHNDSLLNDALRPPPSSSHRSSRSGIRDLTGSVKFQDRQAAAQGGFGDVYVGVWQKSESHSVKVAIKVLRMLSQDEDEKVRKDKRLRRELKIWQRLDHVNILPLYGIISDFGPYSTAMVCPWEDNGTLTKYLESESNISIMERFRILSEVASGLSYLHSCNVIHGDLSGSNVLLDSTVKACVSDFGMSTIKAEFQGTSYWTSNRGGAVRWSALELFRSYEDDAHPVITQECDIYSYGSLTLQALTGQVPYSYIKTDMQVVFEMHKGLYPRRPTDPPVADSHWNFIQQCWSAENRLSVAGVLDYVKSTHRALVETSHPDLIPTVAPSRIIDAPFNPSNDEEPLPVPPPGPPEPINQNRSSATPSSVTTRSSLSRTRIRSPSLRSLGSSPSWSIRGEVCIVLSSILS